MARSFEYSEAREHGKHLDVRGPRTSRPPTPVTPIPRRASASSPGAVRVRSRYSNISTDDDVTRLPTVPPSAIWQDEADLYEIERHLVREYAPFLPSSPSIDELDTLPPTMEAQHDERLYANIEVAQQRKPTPQFPIEIDEPALQRKPALQFPIEIDEPVLQRKPTPQFPIEIDEQGQIYGTPAEHHFPMQYSIQQENVIEEYADIYEQVTNPPPVPFQPHALLELHNEPSYVEAVVEADTVMDDTLIIVPASDIDMYPTQVEDAVDIALTLRARQLLRRNNSPDTRPAFIHDPLDYMRWWLLYPNRLEFLFWLGGALLLGIIMCMALIATGLGLGWMSFGHLVH